MPNLHSEAGRIIWMKEWTHPSLPSPTIALHQKPSATLTIPKEHTLSPGSPKVSRLRHTVELLSPTRAVSKAKCSTRASWPVALIHFLLISSAMASPSHSGSNAARLRDLLRKALKSGEPCEALADAAKRGGVRVIAADFDMTMIRLHSGGNTSNADGNPIFTALSNDFDKFAAAASSRGIKIAVVTFGDPKAVGGRRGRLAGEPLVRRVLKESEASFRVDGVFPFYPPLYHSPSEYRALGLDAPMPYNKSFHIQKLREQFCVSKEEVLLVDDDPNNCAAFAAEGGVALRVVGEQGFNLAQLDVL